MDHVHTIVAMYRTVPSCDNHDNWLPPACKTTFHLKPCHVYNPPMIDTFGGPIPPGQTLKNPPERGVLLLNGIANLVHQIDQGSSP